MGHSYNYRYYFREAFRYILVANVLILSNYKGTITEDLKIATNFKIILTETKNS